jgi:HEAT repeat protein
MKSHRELSMRRLFAPLLCLPLLALLAGPVRAAGEDPGLADEVLLKSHGVGTDGAALLEFFRLRARAEAPSERLAALIEQLAADNAEVREKAAGELVAIGPPAIPALRQAARDPDGGIAATLARRTLKAVETDSASLTTAAARLIALRRPAGAAAVLLTVLPYAESDSVAEEIREALVAVAVRDGKSDPAVVIALRDPQAVRRAAAADALARTAFVEHRPALLALLQDPMPSVRLRTGLALARGREPAGVAVLIGVLSEGSLPQAQLSLEFLTGLTGDFGPTAPLGENAESRKKCRDAWEAWWKATEGDAPIEEFRKRTLTEAERERGIALVKQLGDEDFQVRTRATQELRKMSSLVVPMLRVATKDPDLEVSQRSRALLDEILQDKNTPLSPMAARVIALRKPTGSAEAIIGFVPFTDDESLLAEVQTALNAVTWKEGKPDPAVLKSLDDKVPQRRAAAAEALCSGPLGDLQPAVRKLLADPDPNVRMQVALALAGARDKEAMPVLISLVNELPSERTVAVEEYLHRVAGNRIGDLPGGDENRAKRRDAWAAWWATEGARVELPERTIPLGSTALIGNTVLVVPQGQQIMEIGPDGKVLWQFGGAINVQDAQVVSGNRVLLAEYGGRRVTERNFKGEVVWEVKLPVNGLPSGVKRLPNGHTLITTRNQILEVDRTGREVASVTRTFNDIYSAGKTRDGQYVIVSTQGLVIRLDSAGKEIPGKSFRVQNISNFGNEILPNGGVIIPIQFLNKVVEYDPDGKVIWEGNVNQPTSAQRLPNGHTLVCSYNFPGKLVELDKAGKVVSEINLTMPALRARRR